MRINHKSAAWCGPDSLMYVVGATHPRNSRLSGSSLQSFFLVPGVGAQGGDVSEICKAGINPKGGLLINWQRRIIYASSGTDFADKARQMALTTREPMRAFIP
jgi:orotidine-5'-phosphate decarboxylase